MEQIAGRVKKACRHSRHRANGGNRIELVPLKSGAYANFLQDSCFRSTNGWFDFTIPIAGDANWEVNPIGYIDPSLSASEITAAREKLKAEILREVNYVEISVRSVGTRGNVFSFYVDDLRFISGK